MREFIVGVIPARKATLTQSLTASQGVAPKLNNDSTSEILAFTSDTIRSNASDIPFIEFPRSIPKMGITILASYHGSGAIMSETTIVPAKKVLANSEKKLSNNGNFPTNRVLFTAVFEATAHMKITIVMMRKGLLKLKIKFNAYPISVSCTKGLTVPHISDFSRPSLNIAVINPVIKTSIILKAS